MHNAGKGSKYVRAHGGGNIVYHEIFPNNKKAMQREAQIKKWSRAKKLKLIKQNRPD